VFEGFLPVKAGKRRRRLEELRMEPRTIVLYESPHHIERTLAEIEEVLGDRRAVLGRELTKVFEEVVRGSVSELRVSVGRKPPRGEYALVLAGASPDLEPPLEGS
jgi:16S rRNA (cytidine1402-2'-O)-methyltransferase